MGWKYEGAGRPVEPAERISGCDAKCVEAREKKAGEVARLAKERAEAEELVAVKKEHVIEDARNLKHLMTAITGEGVVRECVCACSVARA